MLRSIIVLSLLLVLCRPQMSLAQTVMTGAEVLSGEGFQPLKGKKFALVTNHSAMLGSEHLLDVMIRKGVAPAVIFTPEHGLKGEVEDGVRLPDGTAEGIPVKSLYGAAKKPRLEDLKGLDCVVFDIQDAGVRFYTYISTMGLAMQAAAEADVPFMVLDRPNPLGGDYISGFVREGKATFTSLYPIPLAHGMTVGELAEMIQGEGMLPGLDQLELTVVRMQGWERWMRWPDTGLPWVATSPNLASFESALLYPGTGLLEGTAASEGRGTAEPFCVVGWPGMDPQVLAQKLNAQGLEGLHFEAVHFTPVSIKGASSWPKYKDRDLGGVRIEVRDYQSVEPLEAGIVIIDTLYDSLQEPARKIFFTGGFDDMAGSVQVRKAIQSGENPESVMAHWHEGLRRFLQVRESYLLYKD